MSCFLSPLHFDIFDNDESTPPAEPVQQVLPGIGTVR